MTMLLVLRPEPGARRTVDRAVARGLRAIATPLFAVHALPWAAPDPQDFDGLMLTSAQAVRWGGPAIDRYKALPAYAVGAATAGAAQAAGFADVRIGNGDATALVTQAGGDGRRRLLHLCGREHHAVDPAGIVTRRIAVYAADAADRLAPAAIAAVSTGAVILFHSPRAAALFAKLADTAGLPRGPVAAISAAALAAAGPGWHGATALEPTDDALLAAAARLCDEMG